MKRFILVAIGFILFNIIFSTNVYATRNLYITSNKTTLFGDEEMAIIATVSGFTTGESIYIKGAFYQDAGTNYFGFTRNLDNWIKNGDASLNQKKVIIGDWDGNVLVKSDFGDSGYKGEGNYKFKLGFYYISNNGTGSLSSVNWSTNNLDVNLNEPDPTSTPIPTVTNTPVPTKTPTATTTFTNVSIKKPTLFPVKIASRGASLKDVLGTKSAEASMSATPTQKKVVNKSQSSNFINIIFIIGGILALLACGILVFLRIKD
ncbi:hypothetical protein HZA75_01635 [Candidatus Roizmanbacteria bacterium]|nr:hypothetical protein [Candidatus Roizmanbacteria bacterium]